MGRNLDIGRTPEETEDAVFQAVKTYIEKHCYAPTIREIGIIAGISSTCTVHRYLQILLYKGRLETDAKTGEPIARALRIPGYKMVKESDTQKLDAVLEKSEISDEDSIAVIDKIASNLNKMQKILQRKER